MLQANGEAANGEAAAAAAAAAERPAGVESEAETLKRDLAELPPEAPIEAYEAMPVEKFGEALLRWVGCGRAGGQAVDRQAPHALHCIDARRTAAHCSCRCGLAPKPEAEA